LQFEREIMLERQREGIAKAKADGKYKGRKPTARAKAEDAVRLFLAGKKVAHIAKELKKSQIDCAFSPPSENDVRRRNQPLARQSCGMRSPRSKAAILLSRPNLMIAPGLKIRLGPL
jgi:hypothetical protein